MDRVAVDTDASLPVAGRGVPMSEAMLERPMGGAEAALGGEAARPADAVVPAERPGLTPALEGQAQPPRSYRQHHVDRALAERQLPRGDLSPLQRTFRAWFSRTVSSLVIKTWFRVKVVNPERFQTGPALYCFNHLSWMDTLLLLSTFPRQPRLYMYGPQQADIMKGGKNRFMWWTGVPVPFSPNKDDMLTSVRRAQAVFDSGGVLGIAPEGAIHVHEGDLLAFQEGAAYLALRAGVPIIPVAITGTSWAHFRGQVLLRLGEPIPPGERPTREVVRRYSATAWP